MASFGFSPSDILNLMKITNSAYEGWKSAPDDYQDITSLLVDFSKLPRHLRELNEPRKTYDIDTQQRDDCAEILRGCNDILRKLRSIATAYSRVSHDRRAHWDRLKLGQKQKELESLRRRLNAHVTNSSSLLNLQNSTALVRVANLQTQAVIKYEEQLAKTDEQLILAANQSRMMNDVLLLVEKLHNEQQENHRSDLPFGTKQDVTDEWEQLRSDLLRMGFDLALLKEHERQTKTFFMGLHQSHRIKRDSYRQPSGSFEESPTPTHTHIHTPIYDSAFYHPRPCQFPPEPPFDPIERQLAQRNRRVDKATATPPRRTHGRKVSRPKNAPTDAAERGFRGKASDTSNTSTSSLKSTEAQLNGKKDKKIQSRSKSVLQGRSLKRG